ncbi:MAG: 16S rRNA methyltransferase [Candidatus Baldrarchaeia archaeon]
MLMFIVAEAALEVIPPILRHYKAIQRLASRRGKRPDEMLLDSSLHHYYMRAYLGDFHKRGRPDIVHMILLSVMGTPLNKEGLLSVYIHTYNDYVLYINPETRLPKNYNRFVGLMEQLFKLGKVPPEGEALIRLEKKTLTQLLEELNPDKVILFSEGGELVDLFEFFKRFSPDENIAVMIGGFPHGSFREETEKLADVKVSIDPEPLEAWVVASRIIYAYEYTIGVTRNRLLKKLG